MLVDRRLIQGALTSSARAMAIGEGMNPDNSEHLFMAKAARCNAAFVLALGGAQMANLLSAIADGLESADNETDPSPSA